MALDFVPVMKDIKERNVTAARMSFIWMMQLQNAKVYVY